MKGIFFVRPALRMALAAATTLALTVPLAGVASAEPEPKDVPSKAEVDRARAAVADRQQSVAQIEAFGWILVGVTVMALIIFRPQGILGDKKELAIHVR